MSRPDDVAGFSGEALKELMKRDKKSNADLCKALGIAKEGTISLWRNNKQKPSKQNVSALAEFFHVSENYFYKGTTITVQEAILGERDCIKDTILDEQRNEASLYSRLEEDYIAIENPEVVHLIAFLRSCGYEVDYLAKGPAKSSDADLIREERINEYKKEIIEIENTLRGKTAKFRDREFERVQEEYIKEITEDAGIRSKLGRKIGHKDSITYKQSLKLDELICIYEEVLVDLNNVRIKTKDKTDTKKQIIDKMDKYADDPMGYECILNDVLNKLRGSHWNTYRKRLRLARKQSAEEQLVFMDELLEKKTKKLNHVLTLYKETKDHYNKPNTKGRITFDEDRYIKEYTDVYSKQLLAEYDKLLDYYYGLIDEKKYLETTQNTSTSISMGKYDDLWLVY